MHQVSFNIIFRSMVQELLNIDQFCPRKFNDFKFFQLRKLEEAIGTIGNPSDLYFIFQICHLNDLNLSIIKQPV
jgi:hypothetical protein